MDVDLRVVDPCGNVLGERDLLVATCSGADGRVAVTHSCAAPSAQRRYEKILWSSFPPPPGEYVVSASLAGSWPADASCPDSGADEVTVVVQRLGAPTEWRTITLSAGDASREVLRFTP